MSKAIIVRQTIYNEGRIALGNEGVFHLSKGQWKHL
jgi:hypothetical protein